MTRTLITGAAGFTGRHLARVLAERGHEIHGIAHKPPTEPIVDASEVHVADLVDLEAMRRIVEEVRPDHVVHLAAIAFVGHAEISELYRSNIVGTRQLLEALTSLNDRPRSVLVASSANIYGNRSGGVIEESATADPANDYGISKVAVEGLARLYADRLPTIVTRPFNYTGRGQGKEFIVPKIVDHARQRRPEIELGNLGVSRDFSDVRMVVDAYARLLAEPNAIGGTFNVCSGSAVSLQEIIELVQQLSGHSFAVKVSPSLVRANEVQSLCGSATRVESVIGPLDRVPLDETVGWMLEG